MASDTALPLESTIDKHIGSTSRLVRQVDLAFSLLIVISLLLAGLFLAILADHWLLKEGLSIPLRLGIFAALIAAAGLYIYWKVVPLFLYPINPVYTADLIEQEVPTFKNSLINWLLLRQERSERENAPQEKINDRMFDGIVRTAAANVQTVPAGHAVDYRKLILVSTLFAILLIVFAGYAAFSPKSLFASAGRVMFPFSGIERPQAAQFRNVQPGDTTVLQGETLTISAEVVSQSAEPVYLVFSTDDGQAVNQRIPMLLPEGKMAFETLFPPGKQGTERGFNSSVDYCIAQGESRSKQYRIDVQPAASVEIVSLQYDFPDYTGLPQEIVENSGDIRALEGTTVTVAVRSTLPLQKIDLVFDDNPANSVAMRIVDEQKTAARGTVILKTPFSHKTFSFRATDENGNASRRSGIYRIEVIPDQPPKVQWADTAANLREVAQMDVPLNETLQLPIQAEDPDFALRYLRLKTESPGKRIPEVQLLNSSTTGPTKHRGQIKTTTSFSPEEKRLAVGDTAEIWVEATDTKLPEANLSSTRRIKITVIDPKAKEDEKQEDKTNEGQQQEEPKKDDNTNKEANPDDEKDPNKQKPEEEQDPNSDGQEKNPDQQNPENDGQKPEDKQPQDNQPEQNSPDQNNPEQKGQQQDSKGGSGQDGQQDEQSGDSNEGNAGKEPSGEGAKPENQPGGKGEKSNDAAQSEEGQKGAGNEGEPARGAPRDSSPDPDTQPGDAMQKILEQMRKEGKFDENKVNQDGKDGKENGDKRERSNDLDPNSPNRSDKGNDPSDPQPARAQQDGTVPNERQQNKNGDPKEGQEKQPGEGSGNPKEGQGKQPGEEGGDPKEGQGKQPGEGSGNTKEGQGKQPGEGSGDTKEGQGKQPGEGSGNTPGEQSPGNNASQESQSGDSGSQMGGTGGGGGGTMQTAADDPNVEYAQKVTNLVLDYLENQLKDKPSDELLNKLGWTDEQLKQFYEKWKKMSENSKQAKEEGKDDWLEALKSMGLRANQNRSVLQNSQVRKPDNRRVTESKRYEPPAALKDKANAYNSNIGK